MARASKRKAKDEGADAPPRFRVVKAALVAFGTIALGCGALYGIEVLRESIREAPAYQMSSASLRLVKGPSWMTRAILDELDVSLLDPDFPDRFSLLDEGLSDRIAAAYERCAWVERVESVVKHDPRANPGAPPLEVHLKFRRPMAFVKSRGGYHLIDRDGVRLPGVYHDPALGANKLLVMTGVSSSPPPVGQVWSDACLQAGARVAEAIEPKREQFHLASIDVSNFGGRRDPRDTEIALATDKNTRIKWGKAPSPEAAMLQEKTPEEKVAYLEFVYQRMNWQVDGVLAYIDIPNEAVRRRPTGPDDRLRS